MSTTEDIRAMRVAQRTEDLRAVMNTPAGRRIVSWIVYDLGAVEAVVFAGSIKDGISAYGHQSQVIGRHDLAIDVMQAVKSAAWPDYRRMREERDMTEEAEAAMILESSNG